MPANCCHPLPTLPGPVTATAAWDYFPCATPPVGFPSLLEQPGSLAGLIMWTWIVFSFVHILLCCSPSLGLFSSRHSLPRLGSCAHCPTLPALPSHHPQFVDPHTIVCGTLFVSMPWVGCYILTAFLLLPFLAFMAGITPWSTLYTPSLQPLPCCICLPPLLPSPCIPPAHHPCPPPTFPPWVLALPGCWVLLFVHYLPCGSMHPMPNPMPCPIPASHHCHACYTLAIPSAFLGLHCPTLPPPSYLPLPSCHCGVHSSPLFWVGLLPATHPACLLTPARPSHTTVGLPFLMPFGWNGIQFGLNVGSSLPG